MFTLSFPPPGKFPAEDAEISGKRGDDGGLGLHMYVHVKRESEVRCIYT